MNNLQDAKAQFSKIGLIYTVGAVLLTVLQVGTVQMISQLRPEWFLSANSRVLISTIPFYFIGCPIWIFLILRMPAQKLEKKPMKWWLVPICMMTACGILYGGNFIGVQLTSLIEMLKGREVQSVMESLTDQTNIWILFVCMVLIAPPFEEYIFRKLLIERLASYGQGVAVIVSTIMFALFHGNLNQVVYALGVGLMFGFIYVKTGNLKITIALHMFINLMGSVVSVWAIRMLDVERYAEVLETGDMELAQQYITDNKLGYLAYTGYECFVILSIVLGVIFVAIGFWKHVFVYNHTELEIPKGKRLETSVANVGMSLYIVFWLVMIIRQLVV